MVRYVVSPLRFFEDRLQRRPNWVLALTAPTLCAGLQVVAALPGDTVTLFSAVGYPIAYVLAALAVISLDVLFRDSGQRRRLAEFTGLCFFTQVPYCFLMIAAVYVGVPDAPLVPTMQILSYYFAIWLVALLIVCLKVVSRLSTAQALVAATICLGVFAGARLMITAL